MSNVSIFEHFDRHGIEQFKIILIKEYEVADKTHLRAYEQLWINKLRHSCVNKNNAIMFKDLYFKNYKATHIELLREKSRIKNKLPHNVAKALEKFNCDCGGKYARKHKSTHIKSSRHQTWLSN
ncbi:unnamed protein product [Phytophthora lilii]|nr:unnamed protein product [Phytophthora lilii]